MVPSSSLRFWMNSRGSIRADPFPGGFRMVTAKRSWAPYQISSSFSDGSAMPLPTTPHSKSALEAGGRQPAPRVDASHDPADVVGGLALLLTGIAGRDGDGAARGREDTVDPAADGGAAVVRVAVGAQGDVDRDGSRTCWPGHQVVDRVREPARIVERRRGPDLPPAAGSARRRSAAAADAAIAGGGARDVRTVRPFGALRLRFDVGGRKAEAGAAAGRREMHSREQGAVVELAIEKALTGTAAPATLVPDRDPTRLPRSVEEIGVAGVETLHVDDADRNLLAELVPALGPVRPRPAGGADRVRPSPPARLLQPPADLEIGDAVSPARPLAGSA